MAKRKAYKYSKELTDRICDIIRKDSYSNREICRKVKISIETYRQWLVKYPEFAEAVKKAEEDFTESMLVECHRSLQKLVKGYSYTEKKVVEENTGLLGDDNRPLMLLKEQTNIKKQVAPNLGAIIHYQTNKDPANWKNRQSSELTGKDGKDLIPPARILTRREAAELLKQLQDEI